MKTSCHLLADTRAYRGGSGKTGRSQQNVRILSRMSFSESQPIMPNQEKKIKFRVSLPVQIQTVIEPFFSRDSYCFLPYLILCPKNLPWLSTYLRHAGCWFFSSSLGVLRSCESNIFCILLEEHPLGLWDCLILPEILLLSWMKPYKILERT